MEDYKSKMSPGGPGSDLVRFDGVSLTWDLSRAVVDFCRSGSIARLRAMRTLEANCGLIYMLKRFERDISWCGLSNGEYFAEETSTIEALVRQMQP